MGIQERKEREREQRKAVIMDCATKIFLAKGFVNASMEEIAECSELSKATLYVYFKNKEEIVLNVMNGVVRKLTEVLEESMSGVESADDKLSMIVEAYIGFYSEFNAQYELLSSQESTAGMDFGSLEGYQDYIAQYNKFWETLCAPIKVALEEGILRKDYSAVEIAITLWSSIKGLMQNLDKVVKTQNCPDYQKMVEEKQVKHNEFQMQLFALEYKKMLRHLSEAVIKSFKPKQQ
jgi:AcrR family transcriptional regulator